MSPRLKHEQEGLISSENTTITEGENSFMKFCPTCKNRGFVLGPDEGNKSEKSFVEECPDCNGG